MVGATVVQLFAMKRYYYLLDGARFIAAFWVMNFHYLFGDGPSSELHWYRYGNLGVQVFFIISGFVIVGSLKGKSLKDFAAGRCIRLFPLFWFLCTITYLLVVLFPDARYTLDFTNYLRSMTMLNDALAGLLGPATLIDPSYWTLTVELIFYAGIALFVHLFSHRNIRYFLLAWFVLSVGALSLHVESNAFVKLLLVRHASYFIFGSALALLAANEAHTRFERLLDRTLLLVSACYATFIHTVSIPAYAAQNPSDAAIVACLHVGFFLVIPLLVYCSRYVTHVRAIQILTIAGGLTYPLYLLHQRIGNILIELTMGFTNMSWVTLIICFEIIMIGTAFLLYSVDARVRSRLLAWVSARESRRT